ncbi:hypothetical protein SEVIR_5G087200v4 [Setaria viridis]|uniref:Uncharacterized protein n=2 Tax=Setaria TaxID=4554 RepID=K3XMV4_SETIT|nr:uncharacterized protein LOC101756911 [Setaria italica]XP_034593621.1 uncharacterized protein LOC117855387 [Setaria viridis]RCV24487.1 hypothetical protein SETIT_5G088600v2 [Setaria italica]TKW13240.1 hypothetical protein SEVIR_5G087200v2 [Setaria viridis]
MKRTRAQQPKVEDPQEPGTAANPAKPQRRAAKQPRQPKAGANKKPAAATARAAAVAAAAAAAAANAASPGAEMAPMVPDVCAAADGEADARSVDCWDLDAGLEAAAWWTWGVDEEKLLGWFPFVEEDFRCTGGRAGDAEVDAFDHDIWSIW